MSDAHIVQGLIALLFAIYEGKTLEEITETDAEGIFSEFGLEEHLTPQRSNGLASMVKRIRSDAAGDARCLIRPRRVRSAGDSRPSPNGGRARACHSNIPHRPRHRQHSVMASQLARARSAG